MQKRINIKFDQIVNKGLIVHKFRGKQQATQMMVSAGLPIAVMLRVLSKSKKTRSSDWS